MKLVSTAAAVLLLVLAASAPAHAQLTGSLNGLHDITVTNLKATADKVPADLYDFRPTDEVRTLGQILAHVANSQYAFCSAASGQDNPMSENLEETATTKAQITAALADAFAYCDAVYASMTDEQAAMTVSFFGGDMAVGGVPRVQFDAQLRALREPGHLHAHQRDRAALVGGELRVYGPNAPRGITLTPSRRM